LPYCFQTAPCSSTTPAAVAAPLLPQLSIHLEIPPVEGICIVLTTFAIVAGMNASEAGPIGNAVRHGMALPPHESLALASVSIPDQINVVTERRPQTRTVCTAPATKSPTLAGVDPVHRTCRRSSSRSIRSARAGRSREVGCDGKHLPTPDRGRDSALSVPDVPPGTSWRRATHAGHPRLPRWTCAAHVMQIALSYCFARSEVERILANTAKGYYESSEDLL
jgi:hypothetical protein